MKVPFSLYDFFGTLAPGGFVVCASYFSYMGKMPTTKSFDLFELFFFLFCSYISGLIIGTASNVVFEQLIVGKWLKYPSENLFDSANSWFFYKRPLPEHAKKAILGEAKNNEIGGPGEEMFLFVFSRMKDNALVMERLNRFLSIYGFCRNCSFALILMGLLWFGIGGDFFEIPVWVTGAICILVGGALFFCFLRFFQNYSRELFLSFYGKLEGNNGNPSI